MKKVRRIICLLVALTMVLSMTTITADAASFTSKPTGVKAKCVSGAAVRVTCKAKAGATGYNFYYNTKKGGAYKLGATSTSRTAVIKGLTAGKKYYFKVQAFQGTTVKTYSAMSKAAKCKTVLKKPTVKVTDKCGCRVQLKMSCQEGTKGFAVYRSTKKKKGYKKIKTVSSGASISWYNTGLKSSTTYYYKVKAVSGKYSTKYSKVVSVKTAGWHRNGNDSYFNPTSSVGKSYKLISGGDNALTGHNILFLGSSVTYGSAAGGVSFADYIKSRNNANVKKMAVSGTTMAGPSVSSSYVSRLNSSDSNSFYPDVFVCQLSLNDSLAKHNIQTGQLPDIEDFSALTDEDLTELYNDATTVGGAIGYITAYAYKNWPDCQVVFFTVRNNGYNNKYKEMRSLLYSAQEKYGNIKIIDMWSMSALTNLTGNNLCMYMGDANHPKKAGYLYQWTPEFESKLIAWMPARNTVTWMNGDKVLEKDRNVRSGEAPSYDGAVPAKPDSDEFTYEFKGWRNIASGEEYTNEELSELSVTEDMTFEAVFEEVPKAEPDDPGTSEGDQNDNPGDQNQNDQSGPSNGDDSDNGNDNGGGTDGESDGGDDVPDITGIIQSLLRAA